MLSKQHHRTALAEEVGDLQVRVILVVDSPCGASGYRNDVYVGRRQTKILIGLSSVLNVVLLASKSGFNE